MLNRFTDQVSHTRTAATILLLLCCGFGDSSVEASPYQAVETNRVGRADLPPEAAVFLGAPVVEMQGLFSNERFPNVVVANDGTVVASWGQKHLRVRRSLDGGKTWEPEITLFRGDCIHSGGTLVDANSGDILVFAETAHPPASLMMFRSQDNGSTWASEPMHIAADKSGKLPSLHMNEHGLTLRQGTQAGRLLRPSRFYGQSNDRAFWHTHFTNAIFSDDGGKTWTSSEPFPALGTGEATVVELADGSLYYNSRRHWAPDGENPRRRWVARSHDGGETWQDLEMCSALPDGPQDTNYGLMAGLTRLPFDNHDILIFSNVESEGGRHHGTVWGSFDGGKTWPIKRLVFAGPFAYSSLNVGLPGTPSEGWIYLHFEGGEGSPSGPVGSTLARFNLSWLLEGVATGDGEVPELWK